MEKIEDEMELCLIFKKKNTSVILTKVQFAFGQIFKKMRIRKIEIRRLKVAADVLLPNDRLSRLSIYFGNIWKPLTNRRSGVFYIAKSLSKLWNMISKCDEIRLEDHTFKT